MNVSHIFDHSFKKVDLAKVKVKVVGISRDVGLFFSEHGDIFIVMNSKFGSGKSFFIGFWLIL